MRAIDVALATAARVVRMNRGGRVRHGGARRLPSEPPVLYEFEACPYCRKVREALDELDLVHEVRPCARGSRHRDEVPTFGGRWYFPYLVDRSAGVAMKESEDILDHLHRSYGGGRAEPLRRLAPLNTLGAAVASAIRPRGRRVRPSLRRREDPPERLVLYQYEACPFCRLVRERLCELDLPYLAKPCAVGSRHRAELAARGRERVPCLVDPNHGVTLYESRAILDHLELHYR